MAGRPFPVGNLTPQSERLFESKTDPQIPNNAGGYVYKLDDMKRLLRFLIIGSDRTYYAGPKELENENKNCIKRLIRANRGVEVVNTIKEVSSNRRNVRQDALLFAYAVCARSTDESTKKAAYVVLSEVCRIPTHLFMFVKYCEEVSKEESESTGRRGEEGTTGWGRAHKHAIQSWYTNFERNPEKLARLIKKYGKRESWSHTDVIRLCHAKSDDKVMKFIFSFIINGYRKSIVHYNQIISEASEKEKIKLEKVLKLIKIYDEASRCEDVPKLCSMIKEYRLAWEHCNQKHIKNREVWLSLLPHMPIEAMIRNLSRMTRYGMFAANSEDEQMVLDKIRSINGPPSQEPHEGSEDGDEEMDDGQPWGMGMRCKNFIHPMKLLFAWHAYKHGPSEIRESQWTPNRNITLALEEAFYRAYSAIERTNKTFYLAVSTSLSTDRCLYDKRVETSMSSAMHLRSSDNNRPLKIKQSLAAAAMLMLVARTEEDCIIKSFGKRVNIKTLDISPTDTLESVKHKISNADHTQAADCAEPIKDAIEMGRRDIDVFVYYTDSETSGGNVHPYEALLEYRKYSGNSEVRLVICALNATELTIADNEDPFMLNIVGCDAYAPWIISEFAKGQI